MVRDGPLGRGARHFDDGEGNYQRVDSSGTLRYELKDCRVLRRSFLFAWTYLRSASADAGSGDRGHSGDETVEAGRTRCGNGGLSWREIEGDQAAASLDWRGARIGAFLGRRAGEKSGKEESFQYW